MLLVRLVKNGHEATLLPNLELAAQVGTVREPPARGGIAPARRQATVPDIDALAGGTGEV